MLFLAHSSILATGCARWGLDIGLIFMSTESQMNSTPKNTTNVDMSLVVLKQSRLFPPEFTPICNWSDITPERGGGVFTSKINVYIDFCLTWSKICIRPSSIYQNDIIFPNTVGRTEVRAKSSPCHSRSHLTYLLIN